MLGHRIQRSNKTAFHLCICVAGIFLLAFTLRAHGQQVHQLSYNGSSWMDQNLNGVVASPYTGIAAFLTTPNDQTHVYYVEGPPNYHVHQLFFNGVSWSDEDLTVLSGAPAGANGPCEVAGFSVGNYQYVYYIGAGEGVHQLLYNNLGWSDTDLSALAGSPYVQEARMVAFTTAPALHVYYTDYNGHVHQLFSADGTHWADQDLTIATGGTTSETHLGQMGGFNIDNYQYVYFVASTGHVHQFLYNNIGWSDEDLTALSKSKPAYDSSGVQAMVIPGKKPKLSVFYISSENHIVELSSTDDKKWVKTDLLKKAQAPWPQNSHVAAFVTPPNQLHVFYVGYTTDYHVIQIYKPKSQPLTYQDMTALTNGGIPESVDYDTAGFSLQNNQYVFYVAK